MQDIKALVQKALRAGYFWPTINKDAKALVQRCVKYHIHGPLIHQPVEELNTIHSFGPFEMWGENLVGLFLVATGKRKFLIVAVDYFSK